MVCFQELWQSMQEFNQGTIVGGKMTIIMKRPKVIHAYNKKEEGLIIVSQDDNNSIYTIGRWFGVKFSEFLQGNGDVEQF